MTARQDQRLEEIQALLTQLGNTLIASERRTARLERILRWGALGIAAVAGLALLIAVQPFGYAVAQQGATPSKSVEEALDRINQNLSANLGAFGMMGQMMQAGFQSAAREAMDPNANSPLPRFLEKCTSNPPAMGPDGRPLTSQEDIVKFCLLTAAGRVVVDAGVLMHRVREDSNYFRNIVQDMGGPNELLAGIKNELHLMNQALASVPLMAGNMNAMTHEMAVMSHSVGSTMGRAGSWMPW